MTNIAIIGAGVAGLAAARALRSSRPDLPITIYEREARAGGRIVSCRRPGYIFDHGAQNVRAPGSEFERLLTADLAAEGLRDIGLPVWVFDRAGAIAEGDPAQNAALKWTYADGLDRLVARLAEGLDIRLGAGIACIRQTRDQRATTETGDAGRHRNAAGDDSSSLFRPWPSYELFDDAGGHVGAADAVLLTQPAPQAAALLAASECEPSVAAALLGELSRASFRRCISVALAYDRPIARPFYALVNVDRAHPIAWLALEHAKGSERCPPGHSLLMAQMSAHWSAERWDTPDDELADSADQLAKALLGAELPAPLWHDVWRWPYALPDAGADFDALNRAGGGIFFAGDYTAGLGRVHLAIESGWRAAKLILEAV